MSNYAVLLIFELLFDIFRYSYYTEFCTSYSTYMGLELHHLGTTTRFRIVEITSGKNKRLKLKTISGVTHTNYFLLYAIKKMTFP